MGNSYSSDKSVVAVSIENGVFSASGGQADTAWTTFLQNGGISSIYANIAREELATNGAVDWWVEVQKQDPQDLSWSVAFKMFGFTAFATTLNRFFTTGPIQLLYPAPLLVAGRSGEIKASGGGVDRIKPSLRARMSIAAGAQASDWVGNLQITTV